MNETKMVHIKTGVIMNEKTLLDAANLLSKMPTKPNIRVRSADRQLLINGLGAQKTSVAPSTIFSGIDILISETIPAGYAVFYQAKNNDGEPEIFTIKLTDTKGNN